MTRIKNPARDAADTAPDAASAAVTAQTGDSPAAAVLAALAANCGGATVAAIAGDTGITVAAARQVLAEREKAGTATRVNSIPAALRPRQTGASPATMPPELV